VATQINPDAVDLIFDHIHDAPEQQLRDTDSLDAKMIQLLALPAAHRIAEPQLTHGGRSSRYRVTAEWTELGSGCFLFNKLTVGKYEPASHRRLSASPYLIGYGWRWNSVVVDLGHRIG
jgi:hypothetical protein